MSTIIYSKQISDIVLNIISLIIFIYLSRSLLSNPVSCFLFYFIFYFVVIIFLTSLFISKFVEIPTDNEEKVIIQQEPEEKVKSIKIDSCKYKILLKKFISDVNATKLLNEELYHHINKLNWLVLQNLYSDTTENLWYYLGK